MEDDYPYKKYQYSDESVIEQVENLSNLTRFDRSNISFTIGAMRDTDVSTFNNPKHVQILHDIPNYYENYGVLSDYFNENVRVDAHVKKPRVRGYYLSSREYWQQNKSKIIEAANILYKSNGKYRSTLRNLFAENDWTQLSEQLTKLVPEMKEMETDGDLDKDIILKAIMREILYKAATIQGQSKVTAEAGTFRITNILACIIIFRAKRILDPCAGWGDRLLGAIASKRIKLYVGVDPKEELHEGYQKMIDMFDAHDKARTIIGAFEEVEIPYDDFDLVFTSPPYYDFEDYGQEENQSIVQYHTLDEWYKNFLLAMAKKAWSLLKKGGHMCFAIEDTHHKYTERFVKDISGFRGCEYWGLIGYAPRQKASGEWDAHPIWCFEKK